MLRAWRRPNNPSLLSRGPAGSSGRWTWPSYGLPRVSLTRLVRQGRLARVGRGLYALPDREVSEHAALAEVARMYPRAVVCLLSALRFHDITTQAPFEVWLAIPNKASPPRLDSLHPWAAAHRAVL
jgi:hypothetical protein